MNEQFRRDVLEVGCDELGRAAPSLRRRHDLLGVRDRGLEQLLHRLEVGERVLEPGIALGPAARRGERHHGVRPPPLGELQRNEAAQRVADDVRRLESCFVHRLLHRVGDQGVVELPGDRRAARVAGQGGREDVVALLELGQDELPAPPGVGEAVHAHHG